MSAELPLILRFFFFPTAETAVGSSSESESITIISPEGTLVAERCLPFVFAAAAFPGLKESAAGVKKLCKVID